MRGICNNTNRLLAFMGVSIFGIALYFLIIAPSPVKAKVKTPSHGTASAQISRMSKAVFGTSGLGQKLIYDRIASDSPVKGNILMTYEVHGFEDLYPKDGQALVDIGNLVSDYFAQNPSLLDGYALYIVPSVNPDGLTDGVTSNGEGRCQISLGIDINRDFDYRFEVIGDARNHTLGHPFAAPESQALRDLVWRIEPVVVIDSHGWLSGFIGDHQIANCFISSMNNMGMSRWEGFGPDVHGYFSAWAGTQGAKAMLLEYNPQAPKNEMLYASGTEQGVINLVHMLSEK